MNVASAFTHVFISRPAPEAQELAALVAPLGLVAIAQPAFDYRAIDAREADAATCDRLEAAGAGDLLVFTSPRAVEHAIPQFSRAVLHRPRLAAIGPATAKALRAAGLPPTITAPGGYTSEDLLAALGREPPGQAFIAAAPGGRDALLRGLAEMGWQAHMLMVYRAEPAPLDPQVPVRLQAAPRLLSAWTSGNAMKSLAQRLPPAAWFAVCRSDWLVISDRLARLARAYGPPRIHRAAGPGNQDLLRAIRGLS